MNRCNNVEIQVLKINSPYRQRVSVTQEEDKGMDKK